MENFYEYTGNEDLTTVNPDHELSYGDFRESPDGDYLIPDDLGGSDYSGGLTQKSNYQVFLGRYGHRHGIYKLWGGFGTYAIAIHKDRLEDEDIKKDLYGLQDYCILDDEAHSDLEHEAENEAWENGVRDDIRKLLVEELKDYFDDPESLICVQEDDSLAHLFYVAMGETGESWCFDDNTPYIRTGEIIPDIIDHILAEKLPRKKLPSLVAREWMSEDARRIYEKRLKGESLENEILKCSETEDSQCTLDLF